MAGKRLAGGRPADAGGRRHPGERRDLLLGTAGALTRYVRLRLAGPAPGPAARARHPRRPRHPHRRTARLVLPGPPRSAAGDRRGRALRVRLPGGHLPQQRRLPSGRGLHHAEARRALRRPPGAGDVARPQRVRRPRLRLLLRVLRRPLPPLARHHVRHGRRGQRGLGHGLLGPALRRPRGHQPAPAHPCGRQPRPGAGLQAVRRRHHARELPHGAGHPAPPLAGRPRHHQLHDGAEPVRLRRLLGLGPRGRPRHQRPLPDHRRPPHPRQSGDGRRPHPVRRGRRPLAAAGALHLGRQLAAPQPRQGPRPDGPQLPRPCGARIRGRPVLPVAPVPARRREVPLGDGPARRHRHPRVARGRRTRRLGRGVE